MTSRPVQTADFVMTNPFAGNDRVQMVSANGVPPYVNPPDVRQCVMCCGHIVRAAPNVSAGTRRSARLRDGKLGIRREYTELDKSGRSAVPQVRSAGGWR